MKLINQFTKFTILLFSVVVLPQLLFSQQNKNQLAGDELLGKFKYDQFQKPEVCQPCHNDFYQQWKQAMMSQAYTHHWDEIEYFKLAVPQAEKDPKVAGVKAGCNGCHAPVSFMAGDVPPPKPAQNSRANESVSCEVCHIIQGFKGEEPFNYNYIVNPGRTKYGNREGVESPIHKTEYSDFVQTAEFCGTCHNEKSPYGVWVKATQREWKEGPYAKQGVPCQTCHMPAAPGKSAKMAQEHPDIHQHLFHGAHDPGKVRGVIEMRVHPDVRETEPGEPVIITVVLHNAKAGHKVPTGSAEERMLWLHVEAKDSKGTKYHLPVDKKNFEGEEYTIASDILAYQDIGEIMNIPDFKGLPRDGVPLGDRIFRLPYFDPKGRMTICQWNTASQSTDYRLGPRETKIETFTWNLPDTIPEGTVTISATLNYSKLVRSVGEFLGVPDDEMEVMQVNTAETSFLVLY